MFRNSEAASQPHSCCAAAINIQRTLRAGKMLTAEVAANLTASQTSLTTHAKFPDDICSRVCSHCGSGYLFFFI